VSHCKARVSGSRRFRAESRCGRPKRAPPRAEVTRLVADDRERDERPPQRSASPRHRDAPPWTGSQGADSAPRRRGCAWLQGAVGERAAVT
jgi:hypothetical protein